MFLEFLNSLDPSTKFDLEEEADGSIVFLDTIVSHQVNSQYPSIGIHTKATDKGLFFHFNSFIPGLYRRNKVAGSIFRAFKIASNYLIFHSDITKLTNKFIKNGFPRAYVETLISVFLQKQYNGPKTKTPTVPKKKVTVTLPCLGQMSIIYKRKFCNLVHRFYPCIKLNVVFKSGYKLSNLFSFKDKLPLKCRSGVVYYTQCHKCGPCQAYLGKTKNSLYERFFESNGHLNPKSLNSPLLNHIASSGDPDCKFVFDDIKIIDTAEKDLDLRFIESIYLKFEKQNLNTQELSIPLKVF